MTTTVVKTIGSTGDYPSLSLWFAACPSNLTSIGIDQVYQGQLQNQAFASSSQLLNITGITTDATRYVELTTVAGGSFVDNATQRGRFDSTLGASISMSGGWAVGVQVSVAYTRISKIQFTNTATGSGASAALNVSGASTTNVDINQCIVESKSQSAALGTLSIVNSGTVVRNSIVINRYNNAAAVIAAIAGGASAYNTVFASTGATQLTNGISASNGAGTIKNCYVGNAATPISGTGLPTRTTCYGNASATGFTVAAFSTSTFKNITDGTHDFLLASGSSLIGAGTVDSTYSVTDLYGATRGATNDVGAQQVQAVAAALAATPTGVATATAALTTFIALAAAAIAVATATAAFPTVAFAATPTAVATATAALSTSIRLVAAPVAIATSTAALTSTGLVTDVLINNTGSIRANQAVSYSWFPAGRIGSLNGITPTEGSGTTAADGTFSPSISATAGVLMVCVRNAGATSDDVYYQAY